MRAQEQMVCPGTVHRPSLRCNKTTTECLPSLQRTPFLHEPKKNSSSLSILLFLFQVDFFSRTKTQRTKSSSSRSTHPTAIVRLHFGLLLLKTPNPICLDSASDSVLVAVQFQFGSIFSIWLINLTIDSRERKR